MASTSVDKIEQWKQEHAHLFERNPVRKVRAKRDLTYFMKWPVNVRVQRQRAVLKERLRVPAAIHQFDSTLTKDQAATLFRLLSKYRPESTKEKATRLKTRAAAEAAGEKVDLGEKPLFVKHGLNHITSLIESKRAKLVIIAHDVNPIELVVWLPALCRTMNVPFVIVKGKSRLGYLVHKKQTAALAITDVSKGDEPQLQQLIDLALLSFNNRVERKSGGGKLSKKSLNKIAEQKKKSVNTIAK